MVLKQQYPGYEIKQLNIIIDVLGGYIFEGSKHWHKRLIRQKTIKGSAEEDAEGNLVKIIC